MKIEELRVMGRATQGVRLIRLDDDDEIASVAKVEVEDVEKATGEAGIILNDESALPPSDQSVQPDKEEETDLT